MNEPRNHHYIPKYYLRGFGVGRGKKCRITVLDLKTSRYFVDNGEGIGAKRDFNRVNVDGLQPNALEREISTLDTKFAEAIQEISRTKRFEGEAKDSILNLIAALAVRFPWMRKNWRGFEERLHRIMMENMLASEGRWERIKADLRREHSGPIPDLTYEEMKRFFERGAYSIEVPRERHILMEFKSIHALLPLLGQRKWLLMAIKESEGCFITTDRPVTLAYKNPEEIPLPVRYSPGFGCGDTRLVFPLTKHMLLVGEFEGDEGTVVISRDFAAMINTDNIMRAFVQVYAPSRAFPYLGPDCRTYNDKFFERFALEPEEHD